MGVEFSSVRNINRETNEDVSLDEVYVHHLIFKPFEVSSELFTENPIMKLPKGYGIPLIHTKSLNIHAHIISNKDLAPVNGSMALAHKYCNECSYAPGKGSYCTPELSGSTWCCGASPDCTGQGGNTPCACAVNDDKGTSASATTTKYQILFEMLITRDLEKFKRVEEVKVYANMCDPTSSLFGKKKEKSTKGFCVDAPTSTIDLMGYDIRLQDDDDPYVF